MSLFCGFKFLPGATQPPLPLAGEMSSEELVGIVKASFSDLSWGACKCHPAYPGLGAPSSGLHMCDSHRFLNEQDAPGRALEWTGIARLGRTPRVQQGTLNNCVRRVDRLVMVRRMAEKLKREEFDIPDDRYTDGSPIPRVVQGRRVLPW